MPFGVLLSVFLIALFGGVHCAAMCGGIAIAVEQNPQQVQQTVSFLHRSRRHWWMSICVMHAGRVTTYMLLGALAGAVGAAAWAHDYLPLQRWLFGVGSLLLIMAGLWLLFGWQMRMGAVERFVARIASHVAKLLRHVRSTQGLHGGPPAVPSAMHRFGMGLVWGMVPCGMIYSALGLALLAGNASSGALVMGAFGLGTLPNLLVISGLSGYLRQWSRKRWVRTVSALLVAGFGLLGVARAVWLPETLAHAGFCVVF